MPNYGYRCGDCKRKFDVFQTYAAYGKETVICPNCQSSNVRRKFNRVRVVVRVDGRAPIRVNTVAVVTRNFVTGIAAITLVTPEPAGEVLAAVPEGERYPVIGEGRSDLDEIAALLEISEKTVRRHWSLAKIWLYRAMKKED